MQFFLYILTKEVDCAYAKVRECAKSGAIRVKET